MSLAQEQEKIYTIKDIYNLPDGERAELIDGQIYYMAPPNRRHQDISGELFYKIKDYINSNKGICRVYSAPFAVYLNADDSEYFEPDISVICDPNKLNDKGCKGAPDWIIEITSPSTASKDYLLKSIKYQTAGVREYWIVNTETDQVQVFLLEESKFKVQGYTFKDKIKVNIYDDLTIDFNELNI